jgi:hypothetical protein
MTVILVPGTAQVKTAGTIAGNPFALIWHFSIGTTSGPWTVAEIQALANTTFNAVKTAWQTVWNINVTALFSEAVDLSTNTPAQAISTGASWQGSGVNPASPASSAILVNFHTGARYRGGHARTYLPPGGASLSTDGDHWQNSSLTTWATSWQTMISSITGAVVTAGAGACLHVVPRYSYSYTDDPVHHKYTHKRVDNLPGSPFGVTGYAIQPRICNQRRRLGQTA